MNGSLSPEAQRARFIPDEATLAQDGYAIIHQFLGDEEQCDLAARMGSSCAPGRRGILGATGIGDLARSTKLLDLIGSYLGATPIPVRAIYFDKSPETNWLVPWHQDLTVAVRQRIELPGFGPWSIKEGIPHVQPPVELLEQMLTLRLHLDDADEFNGALRVLPGSQRLGRLSSTSIQELRGKIPEVICRVSAGDAMLMRPLLLHASSRSESPRHRRVLHIEYAAFSLPEGLEWHEAA